MPQGGIILKNIHTLESLWSAMALAENISLLSVQQLPHDQASFFHYFIGVKNLLLLL